MSARITFAGVGEPSRFGCVVRWQIALPDGGTFTATTTVNPRSGHLVDLQADYGGRDGFLSGTTGHPAIDAELVRRAEAIDAYHAYGNQRDAFLSRPPARRRIR